MLRDLLARIFKNPHYKLLSLTIAVTAWAYVQMEQVGEGKVRARVVWQLPAGLISVEQLPSHVTLLVRGTRADLRRARADRIRLPVDVSASNVGDHQVEFTAFRPEGLPDALEILGCSPSAMTFSLDEVSERKVSITAVEVGEPARGYAVKTVELEPSVVRVKGPRGVISGMVDVKTRPIEVSDLSGDAAIPVQLELPRSVTLLDSTELIARVGVVPEIERRMVSGVPVVVWQHEGWRVTPGTIEVTLEGPASAIERVPVDDVVAFVHLPDAPERTSYDAIFGPTEGLRLRVLHGAGDEVEVVRVDPRTVEVVRP